MNNQSDRKSELLEFGHVMKRDWNDRARRDAKWFINTLRFQQTDREFDQSGAVEVERLVLADLDTLTQGRDPKTLRLLEIGCGAGRMTRHLASVFGAVVGVDVSGEMISQAGDRLAGVANVQLHETSGVDFAIFPDESFDVVLSAYVFQHVPSVDVIESNIRDAWRVLKPGGVLKFQTNSITALDFVETEKDTWIGATYTENEIRRFALEEGAKLISLFGAGTQYCWTTIGKSVGRRCGAASKTQPRIEFYGCTADALNKQIPLGGDLASLTVIASGLDRETADCNSVIIEVGCHPAMPRYLGPIGRNFEDVLRRELGESLEALTQIEIEVPQGLESGVNQVRLCASGGIFSAPIEVEFYENLPTPPKIGTIMNALDDGTDVYARGEKSKLKILVEGLNEAADTGNVRVQFGDRVVKPSFVGFLSGNGLYRVDTQLPDGAARGRTEVRIYFGNLQSDPVELVIL